MKSEFISERQNPPTEAVEPTTETPMNSEAPFGAMPCSEVFRLLGEAFDPLMREYGLGKIEWSDSRFVMIFGHCRIGVMVTPDNPHLVGIRSQSGLLTPEPVAQTLETEVGLDTLQRLVAAYREDRLAKQLPIRGTVTFGLRDQRSENGDLRVTE